MAQGRSVLSAERRRDAGKLSVLEWRSFPIRRLIGANAAGLALVVSSTGAGGWAERAFRPRGAAQVRGRSFGRAGDRRVDHTASCPWPGPTNRVCDIVRERVRDVAAGRSQHEADRELDLLHRGSGCGAGLDEPEPGVAHAASGGFAGGDDDFAAPRNSVTAGKTVRRWRPRKRDDAPWELLSGERCRSVVRAGWSGSPGGGVLAPAATGGQCSAVAVGQYSTLRRCISASSSRSWQGTFGSWGGGVITRSPNEVPAGGGVGRLSM